MFIAPTGRAAIAALAALLLASCASVAGDAEFLEQTPRAIAKDAFKEMREVTSLRILGRGDTDFGMTKVDLRVDVDGNCAGSLDSANGGVRIIRNAEGGWFKADENFWRSQSSSPQEASRIYARVGSSWLEMKDAQGLATMCDLEDLLGDFRLDKNDTGDRITKGEVETIGESEAIAIGGRHDKERTTVWISVESPHRVIKMAPTDDTGEPEALYFEEFDAEVTAETPAKKDIVNLATLGR